MRSGDSIISRVTLLDCELDTNGTLQGGVVSEVCGIFGGKPGSIRLIGDEPGAWWRGVSSLPFSSARSSPFSDLTLPMNYAPGTLATAAPTEIDQGQWTYRITSRNSPFDPLLSPIRVRAQYKTQHQIDLTLSGLPNDSRIKSIYAKLVDGRNITVIPDQINQGQASILIDINTVSHPTPSLKDENKIDNKDKHKLSFSSFDLDASNIAKGFPVARGRTDALDMKLKNPDSILLIITCEGNFTPLNLMPVEPSRSIQSLQLRVIAPIAPVVP